MQKKSIFAYISISCSVVGLLLFIFTFLLPVWSFIEPLIPVLTEIQQIMVLLSILWIVAILGLVGFLTGIIGIRDCRRKKEIGEINAIFGLVLGLGLCIGMLYLIFHGTL